jgi:hypothetical protein
MNVANMHSIAIFLGFLIGTYGLAWWLGLAVLFWQSRNDARDDAVLPSRWVRSVLAMTMFPVPSLLAFGGGAALWWGFAG